LAKKTILKLLLAESQKLPSGRDKHSSENELT